MTDKVLVSCHLVKIGGLRKQHAEGIITRD